MTKRTLKFKKRKIPRNDKDKDISLPSTSQLKRFIKKLDFKNNNGNGCVYLSGSDKIKDRYNKRISFEGRLYNPKTLIMKWCYNIAAKDYVKSMYCKFDVKCINPFHIVIEHNNDGGEEEEDNVLDLEQMKSVFLYNNKQEAVVKKKDEEEIIIEQSNKKLLEIMEKRLCSFEIPEAKPMEIKPMTMECAITAFVDMDKKLPLRLKSDEYLDVNEFF